MRCDAIVCKLSTSEYHKSVCIEENYFTVHIIAMRARNSNSNTAIYAIVGGFAITVIVCVNKLIVHEHVAYSDLHVRACAKDTCTNAQAPKYAHISRPTLYYW